MARLRAQIRISQQLRRQQAPSGKDKRVAQMELLQGLAAHRLLLPRPLFQTWALRPPILIYQHLTPRSILLPFRADLQWCRWLQRETRHTTGPWHTNVPWAVRKRISLSEQATSTIWDLAGRRDSTRSPGSRLRFTPAPTFIAYRPTRRRERTESCWAPVSPPST